MNTNSPTSTKRRRNRNRRLRRNINRKAKKAVARAEKRYTSRKTPIPYSTVKMSECAKDYARAITNPFGRFSNLPCIPDFTIIPSAKLQTKVRGTFSTGTQGVGWVALNPFVAIWNNGAILNDFSDFPVIYTNASYTGSSFNYELFDDLFPTGVIGADSNSPYAHTFPGGTDEWTWRLVAAGLCVRYMGSSFKNQGSVYLHQSPGNNNIDLGTTGSDILESNYSVMVPVSTKREYVYYQPKDSTETFYLGPGDMLPTRTGFHDYIMLIYIEGGDTETPQNWSFEATCFYEIQGKGLSLTTSHSDPTGYGAVISSLPNVNPTGQPESTTSQVLGSAMNYIGNKISGVASAYGPQIANYAANRAMNYASDYFSNSQFARLEL